MRTQPSAPHPRRLTAIMTAVTLVAAIGTIAGGCAVHDSARDPEARVEPDPAANDAPRSLLGEDRQDWGRSELSVPLGQVSHRPIYLITPRVRDNTPAVLHGPVESRMAAAMEPGSGQAWSARETVKLVAEPALFYPQALVLPLHMLVYPPTARELTPPGHTDAADLEVVPAVPR